MRKPNLFIVGAPRCGTTSLWSYLKGHPDIFMSPEKELYFFDSDLWAREEWAPTLDQYLASFSEAGNRKMVGEATPSYLRSERAPEAIKAFGTEAWIVIMLRNPVDVMYSLHSQGLRYGTEPIGDFEAALRADTKRAGRELLGYREFTDFPKQVRKYFDLFGRERVHTIIFEDLKEDTAAVYESTLQFLDVGPGALPEFEVVNANANVRNSYLQRQIARPTGMVRQIARTLVPRRLRSRIRHSILDSNLAISPRPPMDPGLRRRLQKEFEPQVEQLSSLLGRDLSAWSRRDGSEVQPTGTHR